MAAAEAAGRRGTGRAIRREECVEEDGDATDEEDFRDSKTGADLLLWTKFRKGVCELRVLRLRGLPLCDEDCCWEWAEW